MSYMFEVYYKLPENLQKEGELTACISTLGGRLDFRESPPAFENGQSETIVLTYEFDDLNQAEAAADMLRNQGEHVEGPGCYGD